MPARRTRRSYTLNTDHEYKVHRIAGVTHTDLYPLGIRHVVRLLRGEHHVTYTLMFAPRGDDADYPFHAVPEHFVDEIEEALLYHGIHMRHVGHKTGEPPSYEMTKYVDAGASPKEVIDEVDQCVMEATQLTDFTDVLE